MKYLLSFLIVFFLSCAADQYTHGTEKERIISNTIDQINEMYRHCINQTGTLTDDLLTVKHIHNCNGMLINVIEKLQIDSLYMSLHEIEMEMPVPDTITQIVSDTISDTIIQTDTMLIEVDENGQVLGTGNN